MAGVLVAVDGLNRASVPLSLYEVAVHSLLGRFVQMLLGLDRWCGEVDLAAADGHLSGVLALNDLIGPELFDALNVFIGRIIN